MSVPPAAPDPPVPGSPLHQLEALITPAIQHDASGRRWFPALLAAAQPAGGAARRLGPLAQAPGSLTMMLSARGLSGRLGCFEYPTAPPRGLLAWFVEHPERLIWPAGAAAAALTPEGERLRRLLLDDEPPGARARAQARARDIVSTASAFTPAWWRFEAARHLDCLLMTDRLVLTVQAPAGDSFPPATAWFPARSAFVRDLEAARELAAPDGRAYASLVVSDHPPADTHPDRIGAAVAAGAPHLDAAAQADLAAAYLGAVSFAALAEALGPA